MRNPLKYLLLAFFVIMAGGVVFWNYADDPEYTLKEAASLGRYARYDDLIKQAAARYDVQPELIKAIVWRESRFQPQKVGSEGERGLMQVTEDAAADWAQAEKIATFTPTDLFDPKVNLDAGTWYLKRALTQWAGKDDPVPFALAEFNAGRTRVRRWVNDSKSKETAGAAEFQQTMDFPGTKTYVAGIMSRAQYYKLHGEF